MGQVNERVGTFEQNVTCQFAETFQRMARVEHETEAGKEKLAAVEDFSARVTRLEQAGASASAGNNLSADTRPPALIIGAGTRTWRRQQARGRTSPGPGHEGHICPRGQKRIRDHTADPQRQRDTGGPTSPGATLHQASQERELNVTISTKLNGEPSRLFLNISQPPEKRRKVQVAAKYKRLLLELGALPSDVETETPQDRCGSSLARWLRQPTTWHPQGAQPPAPRVGSTCA